MNTYKNFVNQCLFDGPTYFTPLLNETMKLATKCRDQGSDNYFILLILTDGEIHDMKVKNMFFFIIFMISRQRLMQ
jgi:hypothetical protein